MPIGWPFWLALGAGAVAAIWLQGCASAPPIKPIVQASCAVLRLACDVLETAGGETAP